MSPQTNPRSFLPPRKPRKSPKNTRAKALEAMVSLYENDKRIAKALIAGEGVDWAEAFSEITSDPTLGELVNKLLVRDPDSPACMIWAGSVDANGAPQVRAFGHLRPVRRVVWQLLTHEPLDPRIVIKMLCGEKLCFNLVHMQPRPRASSLVQAGYGTGPRPKKVLLHPPDCDHEKACRCPPGAGPTGLVSDAS